MLPKELMAAMRDDADLVRHYLKVKKYFLGPIMAVEQHLSPTQPKRLRNVRCAYCNAEFTRPDEPQKEHVVGRKFVPLGTHEQQWNLHVNACHACNQDKSRLENDLSAITMIGGIGEDAADEILNREARRKSRATSQRTGMPVSMSEEAIEVLVNLGNATLRFQLSSNPQFDKERAFKLAWYQIAGFFFLLTFNDDLSIGYHWPGSFTPIDVLRKNDWANPQATSFAAAVKDWDLRLSGGEIARGYYCVVIKKCPDSALWSWAIEWNKTTRLFGFIGDEHETARILGKLAAPIWGPWIEQPGNKKIRYRVECPLNDDDVDLFFYCK
jgi:hypothetical protein